MKKCLTVILGSSAILLSLVSFSFAASQQVVCPGNNTPQKYNTIQDAVTNGPWANSGYPQLPTSMNPASTYERQIKVGSSIRCVYKTQGPVPMGVLVYTGTTK